MSVFDKVRSWIDGDSAERVLEKAAKDAQVKPRSIAEEFIVKLARSVEEVMQREMVPLPQGTTLIPTEYIIFLSEEDDKEWQGVKRKGLEQGLYHVLSERAKEISGKKKLETQSFAVELRVDGTLEKNEVRVQHGWDEASENQKTGVIARAKPKLPSQQPLANPVVANQMPIPTVPQFQYNPPQQQPQQFEEDESTRIQSRKSELYKLEIFHNGVRQNVIPIYQTEIGIGRGSKSKAVDIPLPNDPEISRRHATILFDGRNFQLVSEGKNPTLLSNREIPPGQTVPVNIGEPIQICSYLLRISPK
jgi:pSer/pThr/pTyr-binding forkhead associated (FHA) protein